MCDFYGRIGLGMHKGTRVTGIYSKIRFLSAIRPKNHWYWKTVGFVLVSTYGYTHAELLLRMKTQNYRYIWLAITIAMALLALAGTVGHHSLVVVKIRTAKPAFFLRTEYSNSCWRLSSNKVTSTMSNQRKVEHHYQDHSSLSEKESNEDAKAAQASDRNFPVKLHFMLSELEADGLAHIVSWQPHGRCFVVHKQEDFVKMILPM
jgi:HSF-type DNA-binding